MQIIVHVNGFNEWVPVPADVPHDAKFKRALLNGTVKETMNGGFSMKVPKAHDTRIDVHAQEDDIIQCILQEMTRGDRAYLTRSQAVTRLLARHVLPQQCHGSHIEEFEIASDDGPDEAMFHKIMGEHVACGNISELDLAPLLAAYLTPADVNDHHDHLHKHFRVHKEKLHRFREKRHAREATHRQIHEHFHARRAARLEAKLAGELVTEPAPEPTPTPKEEVSK